MMAAGGSVGRGSGWTMKVRKIRPFSRIAFLPTSSLKHFFLRCVVSFFRFARSDFSVWVYRPGGFLTFIVHGWTQTKHGFGVSLWCFAHKPPKINVPFSLVFRVPLWGFAQETLQISVPFFACFRRIDTKTALVNWQSLFCHECFVPVRLDF